MARVSKAAKAAETKANTLFSQLGNRFQFHVLDLSKIISPVEALLVAGGTDEAARTLMLEGIAKYGTPSI